MSYSVNSFILNDNFLILGDKYTVSSGVGIDTGFDGCVRNLKIGNHHSKEIDFSKGRKISKATFLAFNLQKDEKIPTSVQRVYDNLVY